MRGEGIPGVLDDEVAPAGHEGLTADVQHSALLHRVNVKLKVRGMGRGERCPEVCMLVWLQLHDVKGKVRRRESEKKACRRSLSYSTHDMVGGEILLRHVERGVVLEMPACVKRARGWLLASKKRSK